ncbi:hypothetical protein AYI70_g11041 [Smittium culicis]|uniref:Uncharacterized protein n=1 Tax=Smittium culicis TaxID=133412 RepID=A0A1R1X3L5_9FUNG|nr:hypothetical protein AYI70_g11041 [Smittium culicis]
MKIGKTIRWIIAFTYQAQKKEHASLIRNKNQFLNHLFLCDSGTTSAKQSILESNQKVVCRFIKPVSDLGLNEVYSGLVEKLTSLNLEFCQVGDVNRLVESLGFSSCCLSSNGICSNSSEYIDASINSKIVKSIRGHSGETAEFLGANDKNGVKTNYINSKAIKVAITGDFWSRKARRLRSQRASSSTKLIYSGTNSHGTDPASPADSNAELPLNLSAARSLTAKIETFGNSQSPEFIPFDVFINVTKPQKTSNSSISNNSSANEPCTNITKIQRNSLKRKKSSLDISDNAFNDGFPIDCDLAEGVVVEAYITDSNRSTGTLSPRHVSDICKYSESFINHLITHLNSLRENSANTKK